MDYEELADMAIDNLREFIHTEKQLVHEEHELELKMGSLSYCIEHLEERIPKEMDNLLQLNHDVMQKLIEINDEVQEGELQGLQIIKDKDHKLDESVKHRDWKAIKKEEDKIVHLTKKELKELHSDFIDLMKLLKRSKLIKAIEEDLTIPKEKEKYEKLEEYYFLQIYKFARAYERIFRHLLKKEMILARK
jgi:hypothetical protein